MLAGRLRFPQITGRALAHWQKTIGNCSLIGSTSQNAQSVRCYNFVGIHDKAARDFCDFVPDGLKG
eukprot:4775339-Amphidinium_carterae.1